MITQVHRATVIAQDSHRSQGIAGRACDTNWLGGRPQPKVSSRRAGYLPVKTAIEWTLALVLFTLSFPLTVTLAVLVKITSQGPAFYAQTRLGRFGRTYRIYKLRTMIHNAEARTGPVWAAQNDCRITTLGKLLRATHLDELPQLWNVLRGDMALIGPRPERPEIARRIEMSVPGFSNRLQVRPGITGLAQMLLPADNPQDAELACVQRKLAHDVYYVRELSFMLDCRIAFSTPCYFLAAAIDALREGFVRSYGAAVDRDMEEQEPVLMPEGCEHVA